MITRATFSLAARRPCAALPACSAPRATAPHLLCPRRLCATTATTTATSASATSAPSSTIKRDADGKIIVDEALHIRIDPKRLPSTIPGISQEELAERMAAYHVKAAEQAARMDAHAARALAEEAEVMKRSLSPEDFEVYMQRLRETRAKEAAEQAKIAAMSPVELHRYKAMLRRKQLALEYYRTFSLVFVFLGSIFSIFYLFYFFE